MPPEDVDMNPRASLLTDTACAMQGTLRVKPRRSARTVEPERHTSSDGGGKLHVNRQHAESWKSLNSRLKTKEFIVLQLLETLFKAPKARCCNAIDYSLSLTR